MAVPVWPSQVPYESVADGAIASQTYVLPIESETEGGPPLSRPRPGPRATEIAWRSEPLTGEQWLAFEQFARVALFRGTQVFEMPVFKPGEGFVSRRCQIKKGAFSTDFNEVPWYRVSFTLIIWNW